MIFGNWLWPLRRRQLFSAASANLKIMASAVLFERHPLERTVRWRTVANELSTTFVTGMRFSVPKFGCGVLHRGVWCDHRDRGTGSMKCGPNIGCLAWICRLTGFCRQWNSVAALDPAAIGTNVWIAIGTCDSNTSDTTTPHVIFCSLILT